MLKRVQFVLRFVAVGLALLVAAVCLTLVTGTGQRGLLGLAARLGTSPGAHIEIHRFNGSLFSSGRIARISLADAAGPWLEIEDLEFSWRPFALLGGTLDVSSVTAAKVLFARRPVVPLKLGSRPAKSSWYLPFGIRLGKAAIIEIKLGRDAIGAKARLTATASLDATGSNSDIKGAVDIRRIDGHDGTLAATVNYNAATGAIEANIAASEMAGGLVATMLESPGLPPLRATAVGRGSSSDMQVGLTVESAGKVFTIGKGRFWREGVKLRFSSSIDGYLTTILPMHLRDVLAGRTKAELAGTLIDDGSVQVDTALLRSDTVQIKAHGLINPARSFAHGEAVLALKAKDGRAVRLPLRGASTLSIVEADAKLVLSGAKTDRSLSLAASLRGLDSKAHGSAQRIQLIASALQPRGSGGHWRVLKDVVIDFSATGIAALDRRVQDIVVPELTIKLRGHSDQSLFTVDEFVGNTRSVKLKGSGIVKGDQIDGRFEGVVPRLAVFSNLAGRPIAGSAIVSGRGYWTLSDDSAKVGIELNLTDPSANIRQLDALLAGVNTISATLRKERDGGMRLADVKLGGAELEGKADLQLIDEQPSGQIQLTVKDLQRLDPSLRGSLVARGQLGGKTGALEVNLDLTGNAVRCRGKPVERLSLAINAAGSIDNLSGDLKLHSRIDAIPAIGEMRFSRNAQIGLKFQGVEVKYGPNHLRGWLQFGGPKGVDGDIALDVPTLKTFSALVGTTISGKLTGRLTPTGSVSARGLKLTGRAHNVVIGSNSVTHAAADAEIRDATAKPHGFGRVRLSGVNVSGHILSELTLAVDGKADRSMTFGVDGRSSSETLSAGGTVDLGGSEIAINLQRARLASSSVMAKLLEPATIRLANGRRELKRLQMSVGSGHITVSGKSGKALEMLVELSQLPMSLADVAAPGIGADGELSGRIEFSGTPSKPLVAYRLAVTGGTTTASRIAGIAPVSASANGNFKNDVFSFKAKASGAEGLSAIATGAVRLKPTSVVNVQASGQLPLKIINALLAERGTRGAGFLQAKIAITGAATDPQINGTASIAGGGIHDPGSGVRLANLQMTARVSKSDFTIDRLEASALPGGRIYAKGRILIDPPAGFPISAQLRADGLAVRDRQTLDGRLDARLAISGALNRGLLVGGNVSLQRFDIQIPDRLPRSVRELDLRHINISRQKRAELGIEETSTRPASTTQIRLNLDIQSDGRIFVRGRGLDAQLGGGLKLLGTTQEPVANGEFRMIRGQLAIVGRRLVFNHGTIGFNGSLDPTLNFEANTDADGTVIKTIVSGWASSPKIAFSSPQLPEDELLARLLFNKSLAKLSPLQIAQLASEVDKIGGLSSGPRIMDQLRKSIGVDVLDVATDSKGNAAVTVGKYVNSKTYVGVQQNTGTSTSRVIVDLDIAKNIKARGETGSDGNSKVGVGIEWNY